MTMTSVQVAEPSRTPGSSAPSIMSSSLHEITAAMNSLVLNPSPEPLGHTFPFMSLPRELRDRIYDQVFLDGVDEPKYEHWFGIGAFSLLPGPIAKVTRTIRDELVERFYIGRNRVHMTLTGLEDARFFLSRNVWCPEVVRARMVGEITFGERLQPERTTKGANKQAATQLHALIRKAFAEVAHDVPQDTWSPLPDGLAKSLALHRDAKTEPVKIWYKTMEESKTEVNVRFVISARVWKISATFNETYIMSIWRERYDGCISGHIGRLGVLRQKLRP